MTPSTHIAIVGGSGSGKTWLAEKLCIELGDKAARLTLDNFYRDLSHLEMIERDKVNFDDPVTIDWKTVRSVADALTRGEIARVPTYDFTTHTRLQEPCMFTPREIAIWDGLWLLHEKSMRTRFSFSVFVDCDESERLSRRVERDVRDRGRTDESVRLQYRQHVQPMHERYVEPQRAFADRVLPSPVTEALVVELKNEILELKRRQDAPQAMP